MSATFEVAKDEILDILKAVWDPTGYLMIYPDKPDDKPKGRSPYGRAVLRHSSGGQTGLSNHIGARKFTRNGILMIQVFTPIGKGLQDSYSLCKTVVDGYEGKATPSNVWFRNIRINEVPEFGEWQQVNVIVEFTYDEIK